MRVTYARMAIVRMALSHVLEKNTNHVWGGDACVGGCGCGASVSSSSRDSVAHVCICVWMCMVWVWVCMCMCMCWQLRLPPLILEWSMRHVRHWLKYVLNLPQYVQVFEDNHINGPRFTKSYRFRIQLSRSH